MAEKPGEETVLGRAAEVEMSEDSGYTGSGNSTATDKTLSVAELHSESGDSTHTATQKSNMAEKPGEETVLGRAAEVEMSEDSGYTGSGNSTATDKTLSVAELHSESGDSTHTATQKSNMAEKPGEETVLGRAAEVEMSEDSGYTGSGNSTATDKTLSVAELHSESGDSTHTAVLEQTSIGQGPGSDGTFSQAWLPAGTVDPASRTEQWVEQTFEVFVKNLDGKTHTIQVDQFETVSTFKEKVGHKLGVPGQQQRITSQEGKTLADDNLSLHDYNIKKHSTLYCQGRLRGGRSQM